MSPIMDVSKDATGKSVKVDNLGDKKPKIIYYKAAYDKINKTYYNVEMTVTKLEKTALFLESCTDRQGNPSIYPVPYNKDWDQYPWT